MTGRSAPSAPSAPSTAPLVLVVDDQAAVHELCRATLAPHYRVVEAENGQEALRLLYERQPDLVLLDVVMPVLDGWETLRRIREICPVPVIMLTALDADQDVVRGLDGGAQDYVVKPFSSAQLLARIRTTLRDVAAAGSGSSAGSASGVLSLDGGRLVLDAPRRVAVVRGCDVPLTATEYKVLELLARHPGRVLSHDQILESVWGPAYVGASEYVTTYIRLLRGKIEADPARPAYLLARRGFGYYLAAE